MSERANEARGVDEALLVLLRAEERAERAAGILESVERLLARAAKHLPSPERERLLAVVASVHEIAEEVDRRVLDAIVEVGGSIEEAAEEAGA